MRFLAGRINRAWYWHGIMMTTVGAGVFGKMAAPRLLDIAGLASLVVFCVRMIICVLRLHDIGKSGWWALTPLVLLGVVIAADFYMLSSAAALAPGAFLAAKVLEYLAICGWHIWLGAMPGETKTNRFGDPPAPAPQFIEKLGYLSR